MERSTEQHKRVMSQKLCDKDITKISPKEHRYCAGIFSGVKNFVDKKRLMKDMKFHL